MSKRNYGAPAFPEIRVRSGDNYNPPTKVYYQGMTLRDWFAGMALQGTLAYFDGGVGCESSCAEWRYRMADAILEEREKEQ